MKVLFSRLQPRARCFVPLLDLAFRCFSLIGFFWPFVHRRLLEADNSFRCPFLLARSCFKHILHRDVVPIPLRYGQYFTPGEFSVSAWTLKPWYPLTYGK